jgi:hypothetical protein
MQENADESLGLDVHCTMRIFQFFMYSMRSLRHIHLYISCIIHSLADKLEFFTYVHLVGYSSVSNVTWTWNTKQFWRIGTDTEDWHRLPIEYVERSDMASNLKTTVLASVTLVLSVLLGIKYINCKHTFRFNTHYNIKLNIKQD